MFDEEITSLIRFIALWNAVIRYCEKKINK